MQNQKNSQNILFLSFKNIDNFCSKCHAVNILIFCKTVWFLFFSNFQFFFFNFTLLNIFFQKCIFGKEWFTYVEFFIQSIFLFNYFFIILYYLKHFLLKCIFHQNIYKCFKINIFTVFLSLQIHNIDNFLFEMSS